MLEGAGPSHAHLICHIVKHRLLSRMPAAPPWSRLGPPAVTDSDTRLLWLDGCLLPVRVHCVQIGRCEKIELCLFALGLRVPRQSLLRTVVWQSQRRAPLPSAACLEPRVQGLEDGLLLAGYVPLQVRRQGPRLDAQGVNQ